MLGGLWGEVRCWVDCVGGGEVLGGLCVGRRWGAGCWVDRVGGGEVLGGLCGRR